MNKAYRVVGAEAFDNGAARHKNIKINMIVRNTRDMWVANKKSTCQ